MFKFTKGCSWDIAEDVAYIRHISLVSEQRTIANKVIPANIESIKHCNKAYQSH